jgi:hypothetical protein
MDKTTIYIPREQHDALEDLSRRTGRPQAHLIREALAAYLVDQVRPQPRSWGLVSDGSLQSADTKEWLAENWKPDW